MNFTSRLQNSIPGGAHTYSKGFDQFPSNAPEILEKGMGAYVYEPGGRKFLDFGMGLRSILIDYATFQSEFSYLKIAKLKISVTCLLP
jgi:glutamate-1-semialdehyde 2,1-aminomutase